MSTVYCKCPGCGNRVSEYDMLPSTIGMVCYNCYGRYKHPSGKCGMCGKEVDDCSDMYNPEYKGKKVSVCESCYRRIKREKYKQYIAKLPKEITFKRAVVDTVGRKQYHSHAQLDELNPFFTVYMYTNNGLYCVYAVDTRLWSKFDRQKTFKTFKEAKAYAQEMYSYWLRLEYKDCGIS